MLNSSFFNRLTSMKDRPAQFRALVLVMVLVSLAIIFYSLSLSIKGIRAQASGTAKGVLLNKASR